MPAWRIEIPRPQIWKRRNLLQSEDVEQTVPRYRKREHTQKKELKYSHPKAPHKNNNLQVKQ